MVSDVMTLLCFRTTSAACASVQISQARQSDVLRAEDHEKGKRVRHGGKEVKIKIQSGRWCKFCNTSLAQPGPGPSAYKTSLEFWGCFGAPAILPELLMEQQ